MSREKTLIDGFIGACNLHLGYKQKNTSYKYIEGKLIEVLDPQSASHAAVYPRTGPSGSNPISILKTGRFLTPVSGATKEPILGSVSRHRSQESLVGTWEAVARGV